MASGMGFGQCDTSDQRPWLIWTELKNGHVVIWQNISTLCTMQHALCAMKYDPVTEKLN
jgi:hypothetical protein